MIIRIIGQGQFEVKSGLFDELNTIDNMIVDCVQNGDSAGYQKKFSELISLILREGKKLTNDQIIESSVIVPPADMTITEARQIFTGEGIFKG